MNKKLLSKSKSKKVNTKKHKKYTKKYTKKRILKGGFPNNNNNEFEYKFVNNNELINPIHFKLHIHDNTDKYYILDDDVFVKNKHLLYLYKGKLYTKLNKLYNNFNIIDNLHNENYTKTNLKLNYVLPYNVSIINNIKHIRNLTEVNINDIIILNKNPNLLDNNINEFLNSIYIKKKDTYGFKKSRTSNNMTNMNLHVQGYGFNAF